MDQRKETHDANKEITDLIKNVPCLITKYFPNEVGARYKFSNYLIDPNKFRFRTVLKEDNHQNLRNRISFKHLNEQKKRIKKY